MTRFKSPRPGNILYVGDGNSSTWRLLPGDTVTPCIANDCTASGFESCEFLSDGRAGAGGLPRGRSEFNLTPLERRRLNEGRAIDDWQGD